jgi:hypothetical protein
MVPKDPSIVVLGLGRLFLLGKKMSEPKVFASERPASKGRKRAAGRCYGRAITICASGSFD